MQLNISRELKTTDVKTVEVSLPFFSRAKEEYAGATQTFYCICQDETILSVVIGSVSRHYSICKKSNSQYGYQEPMAKAIEGDPITREQFVNAFESVINFYTL